MEREHADLVVFAAVANHLAATGKEHEICGAVPLFDHVQSVVDLAAQRFRHVLDGLLCHQSSLVINEHYADTGGFSDHVFAMCRLLGVRFAPRIRDLKEKRLYILPGNDGAA